MQLRPQLQMRLKLQTRRSLRRRNQPRRNRRRRRSKLSRREAPLLPHVCNLLLCEQKPRDHSNEDRSSYPYMLLKHVEGGRSWYCLSDL